MPAGEGGAGLKNLVMRREGEPAGAEVVGVWFGLGQGLCRTPWPTVSTRLCADTTRLGESRLSGPKACRTVDRPRSPSRHTREGDAAVPVCVARAGQVGRACMLVALAGHDGSQGCTAPSPARLRLRVFYFGGGGGTRVVGCVMPAAPRPRREAMGA